MCVTAAAAAAAGAGRSSSASASPCYTPSPQYNAAAADTIAATASPLLATATDDADDVTTLTRPRSLTALNGTPAQPPSSPSQSPSLSLSLSSSSSAAAAAVSDVTYQRVRSVGASRPARITTGMYIHSEP